MLKARADVLEAVEKVIEKAGEIDKQTYMDIVEGVLKRYKKINGVTSEAMLQVTRDMKQMWAHMQKSRPSASARVGKGRPKAAKKRR